MFTVNWFTYLCIAREARENGIIHDAQEGNRRFFGHALVVIVFSALSVEGFINELGEAAARGVDSYDRARPGLRPHSMRILADLATTIARLEDAHESVEKKYLEASEALGAKFNTGGQPYQNFRKLMSLRDDLVHPRHRDGTDDTGAVSPRSGVVRDLKQAGYTLIPPPRRGRVAAKASWLLELQTPEVADWAYNSASKMIDAVATMVPTLPAPSFAWGGIDWIKERGTSIPPVPPA